MDNGKMYVQGFMDKCAAAGYDAEAIVKWAASPEFMAFVDKQKKGPLSPLKGTPAVKTEAAKAKPKAKVPPVV